ncbi:MAG TPA: DinB family protein [Pyrinomonadaceae bacterium]|nr:DinB family protein [Pyrinomonadaceae bacterium]
MNIRRRVLEPSEGLAPGIGFYLSAMDDVRRQLREVVEGLSDEDCNRPACDGALALGALVMHVGEAEWWWIQCILGGREATEEERAQPYWDVVFEPGVHTGDRYTARFCLEQIDLVREQTRRALARYTDADLDMLRTHTNDERTLEFTLRWLLHHLIDHEAQHKGQVMMLKRIGGTVISDR